jgi:hypothetical protein
MLKTITGKFYCLRMNRVSTWHIILDNYLEFDLEMPASMMNSDEMQAVSRIWCYLCIALAKLEYFSLRDLHQIITS